MLLFFSCDREGTRRVKYEVRCPSGCDVVYLSGVLVYENGISGSWSTSHRIASGESFSLSAVKTSAFGNLTARVYVDGKLHDSKESNLPFIPVLVEGIVP